MEYEMTPTQFQETPNVDSNIQYNPPNQSYCRPTVQTYVRTITTEFPPSHLFPPPGVLLRKAIEDYQKSGQPYGRCVDISGLPPPTPVQIQQNVSSQSTPKHASHESKASTPHSVSQEVIKTPQSQQINKIEPQYIHEPYIPPVFLGPQPTFQYMWWKITDVNAPDQQAIPEENVLMKEPSSYQKKSFRALGGSMNVELVFLTRRFPLTLAPTTTVSSLKGRISSMLGVGVDEQKLYVAGQLLQDANHLHMSGVGEGSQIDLQLVAQSLGNPKLQHPFPVTITANGQALVNISIKGADTIIHLKHCVCQSLGGHLYPGWIRLYFYDGRELSTGAVPGTSGEYYSSVWAHLVRGPCTLHMEETEPGPHPLDGQFTVYVRSQAGKTIQLRLNPSDTIYVIKQKIMATEDLLPEEQRIIYSGKILDDSMRAIDYNIQKDATLHLVQRPKS